MTAPAPPKSAPSDPLAELAGALASCRKVDDCVRFLVDLCTPGELEALAGRWQVALRLDRGMPYREIASATGVSTATITRVARSLTHGDGYRRALDRLRRARRKP